MTSRELSISSWGLPCGLLAISLLAFLGCASSFSEKHYFKSLDAEGRPINYYRLTVKGSTLLSSSRYLSGYFDEKAVDAYFSQITQPEGALFEEQIRTDGRTVEPLDETLKNRKLVLILSSNSDAIAESIGQFAENEGLMVDLTRLFYRDRISDAKAAITASEIQQARGKSLADLGGRVIGELDEDAPPATITSRLLFFVNRVAAELGNDIPFKTLDEAYEWLKYNRPHLLRN